MKAYSNDLRQRVVDAYHNKEGSIRGLAKRFMVSAGFVRNLLGRFKATGHIDPKPHSGGVEPTWTEANQQLLREIVKDSSSATLTQFAEIFKARSAHSVSRSTLWRGLQLIDVSYKKKAFHALEKKTPANSKKREDYEASMENVDANRIIIIDEMGINLSLSRVRGWGPIGERVEGNKPFSERKNYSVIGALTTEGVLDALVLDGATNGENFLHFIRYQVAPHLRAGDIVLMDNLSAHKVVGVEQAIIECGARMVNLPPYSPELSPIELCWNKVKALLKSSAARTLSDLMSALKKALLQVTPDDSEQWFEHCGYCVIPE